MPINTAEHHRKSTARTTNFVINPWEVELKLSKICTYKASGPNKFPNWLLKDIYGKNVPVYNQV